MHERQSERYRIDRALRVGRFMKERTCVTCGGEFMTSIYNQKYCSDPCKKKGARERARGWDRSKRKKLHAK